ncbi:MAG: hypothetical protein NTX91_01480 [candidate division SR1 bacterium]|nr:hypothetical protein [candidate division SR1 bacterium]
MKQFAFVQKKSLTNLYGSFLHKYRKYDDVMGMIKVIALASFLVICGFSYLIFINKASTRGYFLRQENQKLSAISFQFEILKTKMLDYKQQNRDTIHGSTFKNDVINVNTEVVRIPDKIELGFVR